MDEVRFVKNQAGIEELIRSSVLRGAREIAARAVVEHAGAGRSFGGVVPTYQILDVGDDTVSAGTNHPIGHIIEWGSKNNPPYAPIRRAVFSLGLKFEEE